MRRGLDIFGYFRLFILKDESLHIANEADGEAVDLTCASIWDHTITINSHVICSVGIITTMCSRPIVHLTIRSVYGSTAITLSCQWQENCTVCCKIVCPFFNSEFISNIAIIKVTCCRLVAIIKSVVVCVPIVWEQDDAETVTDLRLTETQARWGLTCHKHVIPLGTCQRTPPIANTVFLSSK